MQSITEALSNDIMNSESDSDATENNDYVHPYTGSVPEDEEYTAERFSIVGVQDHYVLLHVLINAAPVHNSGSVRQILLDECIDRLEFTEVGRSCIQSDFDSVVMDLTFYFQQFYKYMNFELTIWKRIKGERERFYNKYDPGMIPKNVIELRHVLAGADDFRGEAVRYFPYYMMQKLLGRLGYADSSVVAQLVIWVKWMVVEKEAIEYTLLLRFREQLRDVAIHALMWESYQSVQLLRTVLGSVMEVMDIPLGERILNSLVERRFVEAAENPRTYYDNTITI